MTIRQSTTGTFSESELREMANRRIAWNESGHEDEEADFHALAREGLNAIAADPDAVAVEIKDGEIVSVQVSDEESED